MLTDDGKHLYVSWDEYHMLTERLALKVHASGWEFDQILCLARGGMRPGDVLSRVFDKPLAIMSTSSYRAEAGTIQGRLDLAKYITMPKGELAGRVYCGYSSSPWLKDSSCELSSSPSAPGSNRVTASITTIAGSAPFVST